MKERKLALKWWSELTDESIYTITGKYGYKRRNRKALTGREIEKIFKSEFNKQKI